MQLVIGKEWDRTLRVSQLVVCSSDHPALNIYRIVSMEARRVYPEDLFNHPSLEKAGVKVGDEYAPLVRLRLYRRGPDLQIVGPPSQEKTVDGHLVFALVSADLDDLLGNLDDLRRELDAFALRQG